MDAASGPAWAVDLLAGHAPRMTLQDVATALNIEPRKLRAIAHHPDLESRIVATKINNVWRFPRDELAAYLLAHENHIQAGADA